jgi:hypothetical protein
MLPKEGDKTPALTGTSHDGRMFDLGAPGRRTVLLFTPKGGMVDDFVDVLGLAGY